MKKLIFILIMLMSSTAYAATNVSFEWTPNTEADLAGYKIYRNAVGTTYDKAADIIATIPCPANDATCAKYDELSVPDGTWFWVATAYDTFGNESAYSNEVTKTLDTAPPIPPQNFSIWQMIVSWLKTLFGWA